MNQKYIYAVLVGINAMVYIDQIITHFDNRAVIGGYIGALFWMLVYTHKVFSGTKNKP